MAYFEQLVLNGLLMGAIYALAAVAYTLVYGVVKMVNFAFGELFMLGGFLTATLMLDKVTLFGTDIAMPGLGFGTAAALAMAMVAALGGLIDQVAYKPLRSAPRLAPLITSIAVSVVLQSLAQAAWGPGSMLFPAMPFEHVPAIPLGPDLLIEGTEWVVMLAALLAMLGVHLFVHRTPMGSAMRAAAIDPMAASLVGIPVNRVIGAAFMIGSALAALAGLLYAQTFQFTSATMGFLPGLKALTAAVLGGIGSVPGAALGGLLLGLIESLAAGYLPEGAVYQDVVSFVLLILLLLFRPQGLLGKKEMNSAAPGSLTSGRGLQPGRVMAAVLGGFDRLFTTPALQKPQARLLLLGAAIALGFVVRSDYWLGIFVMVLIYGLLATGLNVVVGFAGLLDLGFVAFWAIGAYFTSILFIDVIQQGWGLDTSAWWWLLYPNLLVGGLVAGLAAMLIGYPTLRVRGDYLAIMTLGFGEIIRIVATNWVSFTNGPMGLRGIPSPQWFGWVLDTPRSQYFFALALAVLLILFVSRLARSYVGRAWVALREDEHAAEAMGISGTRYKLMAYACSGFVGGVVGVFFAHFMRFISPANFTLFENILILLLVVLGGLGTLAGPFLGAAVWLLFLQLSMHIPLVTQFPELRFALLGILLIVLVLYRPDGLAGKARSRLTMG
ncbi:ABC transporter permease [Hydrogenophaga electricum]|uniref:ABC transporter permease n=1 Tax=Hydrogenophaga electricum TaxID=1230953 RepID=A0ABQ6C5W3_9BURK|nr:ABC transporter permease [Hydrogenophaga electricum]GLS14170.1 ABC transporter permease [Hydrogenophaga electricum]